MWGENKIKIHIHNKVFFIYSIKFLMPTFGPNYYIVIIKLFLNTLCPIDSTNIKIKGNSTQSVNILNIFYQNLK